MLLPLQKRKRQPATLLAQALLYQTVRIRVVEIVVAPITHTQYFDRGRDVHMLLNYLLAIGPREVGRKVRSRAAERLRNERYVVAGIGTVAESLDHSVAPGQAVAFIVSDSGPPCDEYVVPTALVAPIRRPIQSDRPSIVGELRTAELDPTLSRLQAWSIHSGAAAPVSQEEVGEAAERLLAGHLNPTERSLIRVVNSPEVLSEDQAGATVFGFGNYVKTMVIPGLRPHVPICRVHELDPWQIGLGRRQGWEWDTGPSLGPDEKPEVTVVAGYHHTHAKLACEAVRRGSRAVVIEKPIATRWEDLKELEAVASQRSVAIFCSFQRRYSRFNGLIFRDLKVGSGEPIDYFASVFEVPLPPFHWYNWPNSRSRLTSNGCHWIDHFLWLNDFSSLVDVSAQVVGEDTSVTIIRLENGATLVLTMTSRGSARLGVRDHCELRSCDGTVVIEDGSSYRSESSRGRGRRLRTHRYDAHRRMYSSIGEQIAEHGKGDSLKSLRSSGGAVLLAEDALREAGARS